MINLIKADLYKLSKALSVKICFLLCCLSAVGIAYILHGVSTGDFDVSVSTSASLLVDVMLVSLLGGVLTGSLICGDFETKNIHDEIASGNGRLAIIIAKTITFSLMIFLLTLPYAIVAVVGFSINVGFAPLVGIPSSFFGILSNASGVAISGETISKSIVISILIIFMYIARLSICIPVAFQTKKSIAVIVVGFLSSFVFDLIIVLATNIKVLDDLVGCLPYSIIYDLSLDSSIGTIVKAMICGAIFIGIMIMITHSIFRKAEIK